MERRRTVAVKRRSMEEGSSELKEADRGTEKGFGAFSMVKKELGAHVIRCM